MYATAAEAPESGAESGSDTRYAVVRNHEEQFSIWRADRPAPQGWQEVGATGSREQCLARVEEAWLDLRPLSLRTAR